MASNEIGNGIKLTCLPPAFTCSFRPIIDGSLNSQKHKLDVDPTSGRGEETPSTLASGNRCQWYHNLLSFLGALWDRWDDVSVLSTGRLPKSVV